MTGLKQTFREAIVKRRQYKLNMAEAISTILLLSLGYVNLIVMICILCLTSGQTSSKAFLACKTQAFVKHQIICGLLWDISFKIFYCFW